MYTTLKIRKTNNEKLKILRLRWRLDSRDAVIEKLIGNKIK